MYFEQRFENKFFTLLISWKYAGGTVVNLPTAKLMVMVLMPIRAHPVSEMANCIGKVWLMKWTTEFEFLTGGTHDATHLPTMRAWKGFRNGSWSIMMINQKLD